MKSKRTNQITETGFSNLCLRSCKRIVEKIRKAQDAMLAESREILDVPERMLRLALNEAEGLAWQTAYPHLLFPTLAMEKIQAVADWNRHEQIVRRANPSFAPTS